MESKNKSGILKGGLIERLIKERNKKGVCATCGNLIKHGNCKCEDWRGKGEKRIFEGEIDHGEIY